MKAVRRALDVLELLAASPEPLDVVEISRRANLARNSAQRLLDALVDGAYVAREPDGTYRVTLRLWGLAAAYESASAVRDAALPNMIGLASALMMPVTLASIECDQVVYTDRVDVVGDRLIPRLMNVRTHPLVTASGRVLACERTDEWVGSLIANVPSLTPYAVTDAASLVEDLRATRERGYSLAQRQHNPDKSGVAVAIRDATGLPVAAIGVSVWGSLSEGVLQRVLPSAVASAHRTSGALGFRGDDSHPLS